MIIKKAHNWDGWGHEWLNLRDNYLLAPSTPGAYIICADRAINRAVGIDENGILTIGESVNLRKRLSGFVRSASQSKTGHVAGWRFSRHAFEKEFPIESLWVSWCAMPSKLAARAKEAEMMTNYLGQHYELPPLNYSFNWSAIEELGSI